jgi:polyphenol oxidase
MTAGAPVFSRVLAGQPCLAGFTTRAGAVSAPPYDSLNFGARTGDDPSAVHANHERLFSHLGVDAASFAFMGQAHGIEVRHADRGGRYPMTDGLVTATPGLLLGVRTADCLPLLFCDPDTPSAGAVHCGWRSLTGGIVERAVDTMRAEFGSRPEHLAAASGPAAGPCCYEVGEEVAALFVPSAVFVRNGRFFADLRGELRFRLEAAGVDPRHIESVPDCTICSPDRYYSHRRDGSRAGRMLGFIVLNG